MERDREKAQETPLNMKSLTHEQVLFREDFVNQIHSYVLQREFYTFLTQIHNVKQSNFHITTAFPLALVHPGPRPSAVLPTNPCRLIVQQAYSKQHNGVQQMRGLLLQFVRIYKCLHVHSVRHVCICESSQMSVWNSRAHSTVCSRLEE